jgi:hypothetical protein
MHDHPSLHPAAALGVDLGASKLVSATLPLVGADGKLPVLVRNQLSNDATPLAVVFQPGLRREMGEAAIDTPASNAQNLVAAFVPRLGAPGEQVRGEEKKQNENENGHRGKAETRQSKQAARSEICCVCCELSLSLVLSRAHAQSRPPRPTGRGASRSCGSNRSSQCYWGAKRAISKPRPVPRRRAYSWSWPFRQPSERSRVGLLLCARPRSLPGWKTCVWCPPRRRWRGTTQSATARTLLTPTRPTPCSSWMWATWRGMKHTKTHAQTRTHPHIHTHTQTHTHKQLGCRGAVHPARGCQRGQGD